VPTARALADAGTRVIIHYGRSAAEASTLLTEIRAAGGRAEIVSADLAAPDGAATLAKEVREIRVLGTDVNEVIVERAKPLRNNPGPNEGAFVTEFNVQAPA